VSAALIPEVVEARDHVRGSRQFPLVEIHPHALTAAAASEGHIGCCDSSPNRHATAHARSSQHPIIRSLEPGEDWCWCYEDEISFRVDLAGAGA
jgi:hypothetical protein